MAKSTIEWTELTWNPSTGCTKISDGCKYCYAEVMARRLQAMGQPKYKKGFRLTLHEDSLELPSSWKKPRMIFVNSMSDLFHEEMPFGFIQKVFDVMNANPHHIFQVLTKRADVLAEYDHYLNWTENIWMGVTIENKKYLDRLDELRFTSAFIKFLSCEPLLGPLDDLNLSGIDWVIVGGESGRNPRPIQKKWVEQIQYECQTQNVSFFFKQWGGRNKKKNGKLLNGKVFQEMPAGILY